MPQGPPDFKEFGYYIALAQVALEMVAPLLVGIGLDYYLGWSPWGVVGGALIGFVGGMVHLIVLAGRPQNQRPKQKRGDRE
jgi:F0F1-type ATP synthase assembly protein I